LEYFFKEEKIEDKLVKVKIWDTAGQENFKSMTRNFYRTSNGVVLVYDVSNKSTFEKIQEWIQSIYDNSDEKIKIVLVGNKVDLPREVTTEEGKKLAEYYKIPFFETSAKDNVGIKEMMRKLITNVLEGFKPPQGFALDQPPQSKKGCSC
jgi:small GTP-binding protein